MVYRSDSALACYVYTCQSTVADIFIRDVRAGGITINDNVIQLGGVSHSGCILQRLCLTVFVLLSYVMSPLTDFVVQSMTYTVEMMLECVGLR